MQIKLLALAMLENSSQCANKQLTLKRIISVWQQYMRPLKSVQTN